jgi:hypothetical protein
MRVRSKIRAREIAISTEGIVHTRKGVRELGKGWLFISPINLLKSRNLLMLAYRKSIISNDEINSRIICLLIINDKNLPGAAGGFNNDLQGENTDGQDFCWDRYSGERNFTL